MAESQASTGNCPDTYCFNEKLSHAGHEQSLTVRMSVQRRQTGQTSFSYQGCVHSGGCSIAGDDTLFAFETAPEMVSLERNTRTQQLAGIASPATTAVNQMVQGLAPVTSATWTAQVGGQTISFSSQDIAIGSQNCRLFTFRNPDNSPQGDQIRGAVLCDSSMARVLWDGFSCSCGNANYLAVAVLLDPVSQKPVLRPEDMPFLREVFSAAADTSSSAACPLDMPEFYAHARNLKLACAVQAERATNPIVTTCIVLAFVGVHTVDAVRQFYTDYQANGRFDWGRDGKSFLAPVYQKSGEGHAWAALSIANKLGLRDSPVTEHDIEASGKKIGAALHFSGDVAAAVAGGQLTHLAHSAWGEMAWASGSAKTLLNSLGQTAWTLDKVKTIPAIQAVEWLSFAGSTADTASVLTDGKVDIAEQLKKHLGYLTDASGQLDQMSQRDRNRERLQSNFRPGARTTASHDRGLWSATGQSHVHSRAREQAQQSMAWLNQLRAQALSLLNEGTALLTVISANPHADHQQRVNDYANRVLQFAGQAQAQMQQHGFTPFSTSTSTSNAGERR